MILPPLTDATEDDIPSVAPFSGAPSSRHSAFAAALRLLDWHPSAPAALIEADAAGDMPRVWKAWRRHLVRRRTRDLAKCFPFRRSPLLWSLPAEAAARNTAALVEATVSQARADRKRFARGGSWAEVLRPWLAEAQEGRNDASQAVETLAWCHALPRLAEELPAELWCDLLDHLVHAASDAAALRLHADPLAHQLWAGELPLTLAFLFPEIKTTRAMAEPARRALSRGLVDLLNGEGMPAWTELAVARPLLACWTRCAAIGRRLAKGCWDEDAQVQYEWFVTASLRLMRRDGSQMFLPGPASGASPNSAGAWHSDLFAAALALGGDAADERLADLVLPARSKIATSLVESPRSASAAMTKGAKKATRPRPTKKKASRKTKLPRPSYHCEWSGVSLLRPSWRRGGTRLAVAFGAQQVQLELCAGRDVVLSGSWDATVSIDGNVLEPTGNWEESCWISNRWVDYVELQIALSENVTLQRHIVLPREDGFLFLADAVVGHQRREAERSNVARNGDTAHRDTPTIAYRSTLPLAAGIAYRGEAETREATLTGSKPRALVMPLALPEWRADPRPGSMKLIDLAAMADAAPSVEGSGPTAPAIELRQSGRGTSLVAPLFFDLTPRRFSRPRTWRQLTVAEDRIVQSPDRAAGYRVQVGSRQWIIYRSLTERGNRTLLGHNLSTEFLVARFDPHGEADPLVEVE